MPDSILERISGPADLKRLNTADLEALGAEIRNCLVARVTENGGHLASNLGVVELTLALHQVFDSPHDQIVWDVGHQAYVHKLLTGRYCDFSSIRQLGGLSGFCVREESDHDAFGAGHAATSVSAALGLAVARDLQARDGHVIAVIGDGSLNCGLAFEGMNNAGHLGNRLIVVLNDNEMSIAPNVGALAKYLTRLRTNRRYHRAKGVAEYVLKRAPRGNVVLRMLRRLRQAIRTLVFPTVIWEELGFTYVGPIDGHDLTALEDTFRRVKSLPRPSVVHVLTTKGKGYAPAEADARALHGVPPSGSQGSKPSAPSYTTVFGNALVEEARRDARVVAITAAMPDGTGLADFARLFPNRFFDVGIAESHALTFAAGLAASGLRPVAALYSTFAQRAYDNIAHDICTQRLPVVLALDRAGIVGEDGRTHHGVFDVSFLRSLPEMVIMAPSDEGELARMLRTALRIDGPSAIRYPRGTGTGATIGADDVVEVGCARILRAGTDVAIIALGSMVYPALAAADQLAASGISAGVVDARFVKPLDENAILRVARQTGRILTVEENVLAGGFGSAVAELLIDRGLSREVGIARMGLPDKFIEHGPQSVLREAYGLSASGIADRIRTAFPELTLQPVARG